MSNIKWYKINNKFLPKVCSEEVRLINKEYQASLAQGLAAKQTGIKIFQENQDQRAFQNEEHSVKRQNHIF